MKISKLNAFGSLPPPSSSGASPRAGPASEDKGKAERTASQPQVFGDDLAAAAKKIEKLFQVKVEVGTDEDTGRDVVRVFSRDGDRLLRQFPPQAALELAARVQQRWAESLLSSLV